MSENMRIWDLVKQPPVEVLKPIVTGRLKGMTDISPQWRYQAATEIFGLCGFGWKYTVERKWIEPGANEEVVAYADVLLYVKVDGEWSEAIPGHGGSRFVSREKVGTPQERLYTSDEAYKMAITDALSVSFKLLGFGADIYFGRWDEAKSLYAVPVDEGLVADWMAACQEAAQGSREEFKVWWHDHKAEIIASVGEGGGAKVYAQFSTYLARTK